MKSQTFSTIKQKTRWLVNILNNCSFCSVATFATIGTPQFYAFSLETPTFSIASAKTDPTDGSVKCKKKNLSWNILFMRAQLSGYFAKGLHFLEKLTGFDSQRNQWRYLAFLFCFVVLRNFFLKNKRRYFAICSIFNRKKVDVLIIKQGDLRSTRPQLKAQHAKSAYSVKTKANKKWNQIKKNSSPWCSIYWYFFMLLVKACFFIISKKI